MSITTARRLAEATSCWLHYEYLCLRGGLFDEYALKGIVGQVLSTFVLGDAPCRARSSVRHPALAKYAPKGRKPELDFTLSELKGKDAGPIRVAVETKWAGSSHCTPSKIIYDIFRLAILSKHLRSEGINAECIFLLAGSKKEIKKLIAADPFVDKRTKMPLRHGVSVSIKTSAFHSGGKWAHIFEEPSCRSAKNLVCAEGVPKITLSFSPGLPAIDLIGDPHRRTNDLSVKFYAMAWTVEGF